MSAFNAWTATLDEALAAAKTFAGHPAEDPVLQALAAHDVLASRAAIEAGDGAAVLAAVARCAEVRLAMPDFVARAFLRKYRAINFSAAADSWDAVFGRPYPPRTRLELVRLRRSMRFRLDEFFRGWGKPKRNKEGYRLAAAALGITPKQAELWTPKTRKNTRGHKPYAPEPRAAGSAHDPFGIALKKRNPR